MDFSILKVLIPNSMTTIKEALEGNDVINLTPTAFQTEDTLCKIYMTDTLVESELKRVGLLNGITIRNASNLDKCQRFKKTKMYNIMANTGCTPILVVSKVVPDTPPNTHTWTNNTHLSSYALIRYLPSFVGMIKNPADSSDWNERVSRLAQECLFSDSDNVTTLDLRKFMLTWLDIAHAATDDGLKGSFGTAIMFAIVTTLVLNHSYGDLSVTNTRTKLLRSAIEQLSHLCNMSHVSQKGEINSSQYNEHRTKLNTTLSALFTSDESDYETIYSPCYQVTIPPTTALTIQDMAYLKKQYGFKDRELGYVGLDDLASLCYRRPGTNDDDYKQLVESATEGHSLIADLVESPLSNFTRWHWKVDPQVWAKRVNQTLAVVPFVTPDLDRADEQLAFINRTLLSKASAYDFIRDGTALTSLRRHKETRDSVLQGQVVTVVPGAVPYAGHR